MLKKNARWLIPVGAALLCAAALLWCWTPADYISAGCQLSRNAAWISVDWTSYPVDAEAVRRLAESAAARRMTTLFPFASYIRQDGSFSPSYTHARAFVDTFRQYNQEIDLLAWIGLPLANERHIGVKGWVDLSSPETRRQVVAFVVQLVNEAGFDGVHLNAETVQNNDADFLLLLDEIRQAIGADKIISVAGSHWIPESINAIPVFTDFRWTGVYYREVAKRVDQIAVMLYDSQAFAPALYRLWVREEVRGLQRNLDGADVELLIGLSVSQEETPSHHPAVETLANGLAGVCAGKGEVSLTRGIAVYADWEFSAADQAVWLAWQR
ncbi:MAG TPA: glycoside hydrolase family 18 protein [Anaerolineaceae bacterium]|nr:glycoside hydrolase family 18 protein [Anaerolineaceae bacterium]HPN53205.1 glycoside hydrolase family 18 protein [Anaerolineaceae bacterium]